MNGDSEEHEVIREMGSSKKDFSTSSTGHIGRTHGKSCAVGTESLVCGPVLVIDLLLNRVK